MAMISKNVVLITIVVSLTIAGVSICLAMYSDEIEKQDNQNEIVKEECKHDWVVTSKYVLLKNSYKTISKCSKCGKEIE